MPSEFESKKDLGKKQTERMRVCSGDVPRVFVESGVEICGAGVGRCEMYCGVCLCARASGAEREDE